MNDTFYVTKKTKIKCPWGLVPMKELDEDGHGVFKMNGNTPYPIMNMMDNSTSNNLPDFQRCKNMANPDVLTERASELAVPGGQATVAASAPTMGACSCKPIFPAPWINASLQTLAGNMPTLNKNSCIVCAKGFGVITIEGMTAGGIIGPAEIQKFVNDFEDKTGIYASGIDGYSMQKKFTGFLVNNVWNKPELSNDDKIAVAVACFDGLSDDQKIDFNLVADSRALKNPDYSDWGSRGADVAWPGYLGLDPDPTVAHPAQGVSPSNLPGEVDRIGSLFGSNFGGMKEDGEVYTQYDRSITYVDNGKAYHQYDIDTKHYFTAIDCIESGDTDAMNKMIDEINLGLSDSDKIEPVDDDIMLSYMAEYEKFQKDASEIASISGSDSKYGMIGQAAPWTQKGTDAVVGCGGAVQLNTPVSGNTLLDLGILIYKK